MRRSTGWEERDCDYCMQSFTPERCGQQLCSRCYEQEQDAEKRKSHYEEDLL